MIQCLLVRTSHESRQKGYLPLEELFPGRVIEGYAEIGDTLYAAAGE